MITGRESSAPSTGFRCCATAPAKPVGLTCRVGRAVFGSVKLIDDLVRTGDSILLLGRPGVGKTTMLREVARVLADDVGKRVVVVDTSNEIAGDGDVPHPAIGSARRLQVARTELQHRVMIEAVENHMPGGDHHRRDEHRAGSPGGPNHRRAGRSTRRNRPRQHACKRSLEPEPVRPCWRHAGSDARRHRGAPAPDPEDGPRTQARPNLRHGGRDPGTEPARHSPRLRDGRGPHAARYTRAARTTVARRNGRRAHRNRGG